MARALSFIDVAPTVQSRNFEEEYWQDTRGDGQFDTILMNLTDRTIRVSSPRLPLPFFFAGLPCACSGTCARTRARRHFPSPL